MNLLLHMPSCLWGFQHTLIPCAILCLTSHSLFVEGFVVSFIFNIYIYDFWISLWARRYALIVIHQPLVQLCFFSFINKNSIPLWPCVATLITQPSIQQDNFIYLVTSHNSKKCLSMWDHSTPCVKIWNGFNEDNSFYF